MPPVIGISQCLDERGRWRAGREYAYLDCAYARAVTEAGALALHLPLQDDAPALVARIDGLLLPGGDDFPPPSPYPDDVHFDPVPPRQLAFDRRLLAAALERKLPVLGVCYGMQLIALEAGATLHYDLPTDCPDAAPHRLPERGDERDTRHALELVPGTRLAAALGATPLEVNSLHHQALATPGRNLRICARAPDGVIEAIEADGDAFRLGVQWHPEKMPAPHRAAIFGAFVGACRETTRR